MKKNSEFESKGKAENNCGNESPKAHKVSKSKKMWRKMRISLFVTLFTVIFLLTSALVGATVFYNFYLDKISGGNEVIGGNNVEGSGFDETDIEVYAGLSEEVKNIAVFGVDSRNDSDAGSRSDAMMIVSFDMKHNKVKAVSIMRDSLVSIPGYQNRSKINSAYAKGGVELAINTINTNFKMNITDYIVLNFNQMARVVDAVGGIEVEITEAERRNANKYIREMAEENRETPDLIEKSGTVSLFGYQAVAYARIRAVGNADFQRTERQREVMEKIMNKALSVGIMEYPELINAIIPMMKTSLSGDEITEMMWHVINNGKPTFEQGRFPIDGTFRTNEYYAMEYDMDEAAEKLHSFIYDDVPFYD